MLIVVAIALAKLVLHCYFNNRYGYFRDEFDYLACGDHLAWGYVDQPPLIPFLARISRVVLGESLRSIRFLPALASSLWSYKPRFWLANSAAAASPLLLSAVTILIAPQYLSNGSLLGTNCLEPNLWMGCAYFAILAIKRDDPRYWLGFGVVAGLGLEEKYSIAVFGFGIVVGLLLTEQRRVFANKWIWLGGLAAFVVFLPNLLWNIHYHWPFVELMRNIKAEGRDVVLLGAAVLLSADASGSSRDRAHLDHRPAGVVVFGAAEAVPLSGLELSGRVHGFLRLARQELLPVADLSHAAGGGRGRDRSIFRAPATLLVETRAGGCFAGRRRAGIAAGCARSSPSTALSLT